MIKLDKNGLTVPSVTANSITAGDTSVSNFNQFVIKNENGEIEETLYLKGHIKPVIDDEKTFIDFGYDYGSRTGALIALRSTEYEDAPGSFLLSARDAEKYSALRGFPDGTLTWDDSKIITNSSLVELENNLYFIDNSTSRGVGYKGYEGAKIAFYSASHTNDSDKGRFAIAAQAGENNTKYLVGRPDGTLTWNGSNIVTYGLLNNLNTGIVYTTENSRTSGVIGYNFEDGARLAFYNKNHATWTGYFQLSASDGSSRCELVGKPDGTLQWNNVSLDVPIGTIIAVINATSSPSGYLHCGGGEVSKTTYSKLYNLIGNNFGTASDSTKFKLPNLYNKVLWGGATSSDSAYKVLKYNEAGLPNITGTMASRKTATTTPYAGGITGANGAFKFTSGEASGSSAGLNITGNTYGGDTVSFSAANSNSIYGASSTVRPPSLNVLYYIKY